MPSFKNNTILNTRRKNIKKVIKSIVQLMVIVLLFGVVINAVFIMDRYEPLKAEKMTNTEGFIALSYFGVDRSGDTKYISKDVLEKQLQKLKDAGFETISQNQIIDFYKSGKPLPKRALFLSFEDGRNDSSIFSQSILEALNYKATMFTYANKMHARDSKFLKPNHLKTMKESGYWELGTNGNRLTYINIFNADKEYLGEMEEKEVADKTTIEYYNHFLMDYLRDEYLIPKETKPEMIDRIRTDYEMMDEVYTKYLGNSPKAYAIMHSNSLYHNTPQNVSKVNDKMIKKYFELHFNQDLQSFNDQKQDIYRLNRLQVAPDWPINHLLMKLSNDSKWDIDFDIGNEVIAKRWKVDGGVAEFDDEEIILTSEPDKEVMATLNQQLPKNFLATLQMHGKVMGEQSIVLSDGEKKAVKLSFVKNELFISEGGNMNDPILISKHSLPELQWDGEDYAFKKAGRYDYEDIQNGSRIDKNEYPSTMLNDRTIMLRMDDGVLDIKVDNQSIARVDIPFTSPSYHFSLSGGAIAKNTSHEDYVDTIFDSKFSQLEIKEGHDTVYSIEESTVKKMYKNVQKKASNVVDYFIEKF